MVARDALVRQLHTHGATELDGTPDRGNSISGSVLRCIFRGRRTVAVGSDASAETCIGAVLDVLDLHLHGGATPADGVNVVLGERTDTEALEAIGTLLGALRAGPSVDVLVARADGSIDPVPTGSVDFAASPAAERYQSLLHAIAAAPPSFLRRIQEHAGLPALRAYPQLTDNPSWSLRLEGLEVGRFRHDRGWLGVGKPGRNGASSEARTVWTAATGGADLGDLTESAAAIRAATRAITSFADAWLGAPTAARKARQNEHALESRILRGAAPVETSAGTLTPLRLDAQVNWGSQFPTRWGSAGRDKARYLDAVLRSGSVPWAVEMKVEGAGGVGQYYRHAIGQAVLYRHFVRTAEPLGPYFTHRGLDRARCRAAIAVPDLSSRPVWQTRLRRLADLFDVEVAEVDQRHAVLRP